MYQMPVRAIKNILKKELEGFNTAAYRAVKEKSFSDVPSNMITIAYAELMHTLEKCEDYESIEEYISFAGYGMSLEEWINSL